MRTRCRRRGDAFHLAHVCWVTPRRTRMLRRTRVVNRVCDSARRSLVARWSSSHAAAPWPPQNRTGAAVPGPKAAAGSRTLQGHGCAPQCGGAVAPLTAPDGLAPRPHPGNGPAQSDAGLTCGSFGPWERDSDGLRASLRGVPHLHTRVNWREERRHKVGRADKLSLQHATPAPLFHPSQLTPPCLCAPEAAARVR